MICRVESSPSINRTRRNIRGRKPSHPPDFSSSFLLFFASFSLLTATSPISLFQFLEEKEERNHMSFIYLISSSSSFFFWFFPERKTSQVGELVPLPTYLLETAIDPFRGFQKRGKISSTALFLSPSGPHAALISVFLQTG